MQFDLGTEQEVDRLIAERSADPDGLISPERMEQGFTAAEARTRASDAERAAREDRR